MPLDGKPEVYSDKLNLLDLIGRVMEQLSDETKWRKGALYTVGDDPNLARRCILACSSGHAKISSPRLTRPGDAGRNLTHSESGRGCHLQRRKQMNVLRYRLELARKRLERFRRGTGPYQTPEFPRIEVVPPAPLPPQIGLVTHAELTLLYRHLLNDDPPRPLVTHEQRLAYLRKQVSDRVLRVHLANIRRGFRL